MKALILPMIEQAAMHALVSKKAPFMRKSKLGLGFMALSGLFLVTAIVFGLIAAYGWLLTEYDQPIAAGFMALAVLGVSLLSGLTGYYTLRSNRKIPATQSCQDQAADMMAMATDVIENEFGEIIEEYPKTAILLASLAGFAVSERIGN